MSPVAERPHATTPNSQYARWAQSVLGTREGSGRESRWAAAAGISPSTPWCSAFVAYGLKKLGIKPPSDPAYSGSWLTWSGGEKIQGGIARARPGDLLIFDWGDGGRTDHVAIYTGSGRMISGNDRNNSVGSSPVPTSNLVGIVRPKAFGSNEGFQMPLAPAERRRIQHIAKEEGGKLGDWLPSAGEAASDVGSEVISGLASLFGEKAAPILLNVGLVGGGAFLLYFGIARAVGVGHPVGTPIGAARGAAIAGVEA